MVEIAADLDDQVGDPVAIDVGLDVHIILGIFRNNDPQLAGGTGEIAAANEVEVLIAGRAGVRHRSCSDRSCRLRPS